MDLLQDKMAVVLFQLPPSWTFNPERLNTFLTIYAKRRPCVFEFRNATWYCQEAYDILARHSAGFCIYNLAGHTSPIEVTSNVVYIRLHGPGAKYAGSYTDAALQSWSKKILAWAHQGHDVFCYFDNDIGGHAPRNALTLKGMTEKNKMQNK